MISSNRVIIMMMMMMMMMMIIITVLSTHFASLNGFTIVRKIYKTKNANNLRDYKYS